MADTTAPSLPLTLADLRTLLPAPPADTAVTRAIEAIACVDQAVRAQLAELELLEQVDRRDVAALVEAAGTEGDLTKVVNAVKPSNRAVVELRLDMLRRARALLGQQYDEAERTDPAHLAWLERCRELTEVWQRAMTLDDEKLRFAALIDLTRLLG
jgi:hypothetical protein